MNRRSLILSAVALGAAGFGGATWYARRPDPNAVTETLAPEFADALIRPHSPIMGPVDAPVTIVEFFDPACEACRYFYPIVEDIKDKYPEDVRVVIRYTPFHGAISENSIKLLEAARMQGKFDSVLNALIVYQNAWAAHGTPDLKKIGSIAAGAGLDLDLALEQIKSPEVVAVFNQDRSDVAALNITKTPTFFVNGKSPDPASEAVLRALVDAEVAALSN
jgi:protein-disulfide isomerase